jgi:hypothetical protein
MALVHRCAITRSLSLRLAHVSPVFRAAVITGAGETVNVRMLIDPNEQLIRDSDPELPAPTQIRLPSTRRFPRVELLAADTEKQ